MSKQWQIRRGTTAENDVFTGAVGELTMDTDKNQIRLHDGTTEGGHIFGDTVVEWQAPTAENNYTWYRKYRSGWVEQGVAQRITGGGSVGVVLPVPMSDANYTILISQNNSDGAGTYFQCQYHTPTATGFTVISQYGQSRASRPFLWYVCGMAA